MQVSNINNRPNQFLITINSLNYNLIKLDNYYIPDFYIVDMFQSYKSLIAIRGFELRKITSIPNEYPSYDEGDDNLNELLKQGILYNFDDVYGSHQNNDYTIDYSRPLIILDCDHWDYSTTTGKYRNIFLGENKRLTEKKIDFSIYSLADLNS